MNAPSDRSERLYPTLGRRRRAVTAWCLFDFANSSYATLIITVVFSVYFREAVVNAPDNTGDRLWGMANFVAMLIVVLTSPVLGALADYSGRRKRLLILTTLQTVVATALMLTVAPGQIAWALALYVVATVGFESGYVFYNSFLRDVSTPRTAGAVSGWAWGIGYWGGLAALGICFPLIRSELRDASGALEASAVSDRQLSFLLVSLFYLLFALPAFLWLRESEPLGRAASGLAYLVEGLRRVRRTVRSLRAYRETGKFVLASLFFTDGITTIIAFAAIYATTTFGFSSAEVTILFIVLNVIAFPSAVIAGHLADAVGPKSTLILTLWLWIGVVILAFAAQGKAAFWIMAAAAAVGMGSTQAVGRSFMSQITPVERGSEFFGFYVLSGKFASMFGPLLFGLVSSWSGSQRWAVISLLPFFAAGLVLVWSVDEREARLAATRPGP